VSEAVNGMAEGPLSVDVVVGLDERAIRAAFWMWEMVSAEKGKPFDQDRVARYFAGRIEKGSLLPIIAWDGENPIGMVFLSVDEDPFTGEMTAFGDHAFVRPEYRRDGIYRMLVDAGMQAARLCGCEAILAPVGHDAGFLRAFYSERGFQEAGVFMRWRMQ